MLNSSQEYEFVLAVLCGVHKMVVWRPKDKICCFYVVNMTNTNVMKLLDGLQRLPFEFGEFAVLKIKVK